MSIKCCKDCVPPQRYPGCHEHCQKYLEEKRLYEIQKQKERAAKSLRLTNYDFDEIAYSACKRHKRRQRE